MSVSPTCNLYCNESVGDGVSLDADICNDSYESFESLIDDDDENYISSVFNSEVDQIQGSELLAKYRKLPGIVNARREAIKWMLQMHIQCRFRPETVYLSVNYLDRFLFLNNIMPGKGWQWQLLSVTCLVLAAKMEETNIPNLLDLQLIEPRRYFFKPKTVQRMELVVMSCLKWRLHMTTPFDFVHYFISKISCFRPQWSRFSYVSSHASDLILRTSRVIDFLDFPPSTIAAAVVVWATNHTHTLDEQKLCCFHKRVNQDMVKRCYSLIRKNVSLLLPNEVVQKPEHVPANYKLRVVFRGSCDDPKTCKKETKSSQDLLTNKC